MCVFYTHDKDKPLVVSLGRTGRAGHTGRAISYVTQNDKALLWPLTQLLRQANQVFKLITYICKMQDARAVFILLQSHATL